MRGGLGGLLVLILVGCSGGAAPGRSVAAEPAPAPPAAPPAKTPEELILEKYEREALQGNIKLTLKAGGCDGGCPEYTVDVYDDGTISWHGERHVQSIGGRRDRLDTATLDALRAVIAETTQPVGVYQDCRDRSTTSVEARFADYWSFRNFHCQPAPALDQLEARITALLDVDRWILGNPDAISGPLPSGDHLVLRHERTMCFGECLYYVVDVYDDGTMLWILDRQDGRTYPAAMSAERVQSIIEAVAEARFFELDVTGDLPLPPCPTGDEYAAKKCEYERDAARVSCSDTSGAIVTFQAGGVTRRRASKGCGGGKVTALGTLIGRIEDLIGPPPWAQR